MLVVNYESDELIMQTATSVAKREYHIKLASGATYPLGRKYVKGGRFNQGLVEKAMTKLGKTKEEHYEIELVTTYGDLSLATYLMEKQIRKIYQLTKCDRINFWLGPSNGSNFRFKSAVTQPYKNNRGEKPELVNQLRDYLIMIHGAKEIEGHEADDALGLYQKESIVVLDDEFGIGRPFDGTIAVHCDKDIFMIPGWHFDTMTDQFIYVTDPGELHIKGKSLKGTGLAFFYAQLLMGDPTDTIPSLAKGYGPVKIMKLFKECEKEEDYLGKVMEEYQHHIGMDWQVRLEEQADLVWILRREGETGSKYIRSKL